MRRGTAATCCLPRFTVCAEKEQAKEVLRLRPSGYLTKPATREQIAEELRNLRYPVPDAAPSLKRTCV